MTNKNKNTNELVVGDEDTTATLEVLSHYQKLGVPSQTRTAAVGESTRNLNTETESNQRKLERKEKLLRQRNRTISLLKAEIRERDVRFRALQESADEIRLAKQELESGMEISKARKQLSETTGQLLCNDAVLSDLQSQQRRTEDYADQLRRQLSDLHSDSKQAIDDRDTLKISVACSEQKVEKLTTMLKVANNSVAEMTVALENATQARAEEIRLLRFELGETEQTLEQNVNISQELASDLIDTRTFRDELERMLSANEEESDTRIKDLCRTVTRLEKTITDNKDKLETKSEAINALLTELARTSHGKDSIGEIEEIIQGVDDCPPERIDDRRGPGRERITRLLIGKIDDQELRFPLFKDRLTIGRTRDNDIQLNADYVSRHHAVITTEGVAARVVDYGSRNGVYVNSKRVSEKFLKHGDVVSIGIAEFRYEELFRRDG